jgi:hypothetical protein
LDRHDFVLHEAHKRKESAEKEEKKVAGSKGKKRKEAPPPDDSEAVGVRRSARKLGIKADPSEAGEFNSSLDDENDPEGRPARALKELSASQNEHDSAEQEHLRWAGRCHFAPFLPYRGD